MENLYLALKLRGRGIHMEDGCRRQFMTSSTSQFHTFQVFLKWRLSRFWEDIISFSNTFLYMLGRFMTQIHRGNLYRASYITSSHYQMLTLNPVLINCSKEVKSWKREGLAWLALALRFYPKSGKFLLVWCFSTLTATTFWSFCSSSHIRFQMGTWKKKFFRTRERSA